MALEGQLLRLAEGFRIPRQDFLKNYLAHELDPNWLDKVGKLSGQRLEGLRQEARRSTSRRCGPRSRRSPTTPARRSPSSAACA